MKYKKSFTLTFTLFVVPALVFSQGMSFDTSNVSTVNMLGNGYIYPKELEGEEDPIQTNGLTLWKDPISYARIYFYTQKTGELFVSVKVRSLFNKSRIKLSIDNSMGGYEKEVKRTDSSVILQVGKFKIDTSCYHYIEIKGLTKNGKYFPDIQAIVLSGEAAKGLKFNNKEYRGAASTHLHYPLPGEDTASGVAWFYSEVNVPVGVNSINAYYETNGFSDGYSGIQINSDTERRFIFSVWSNYRTDNPKEIPEEYAVKLVKRGRGVFADQFGNEGSGGHSHLVFPWRNGTTYKILVGAKPSGDHTIFTAFFFAPEIGSWQLISQWDKAMTHGKLLTRLYAFVENFGPNGNDYFKAYYGNQWVCNTAGDWIELKKAGFTTTASPTRHPRYDYGAGIENNWFFMYSGGFKELNNVGPGQSLIRNPSGQEPHIDFSALPDK
ncbi:MAG TPA: DUF3472 domain-containing protein [Puia sp.]|nr:DUF3472 domain-containing protein [Puia sp.]